MADMNLNDPSSLRFLGKRASMLFGDGVPLTDAVIKVTEGKGLNEEQIKRVCEAANQATYSDKWKDGGNVRNVTFDGGAARPEKVIEATKAKPVAKANLTDYATTPTKRDDDLGEVLKAIFGKKAPPPKQKTAGADPRLVASVLRHAERDVSSKVSSMNLRVKKAAREMCQATRQAVLNDETMGKIAAAWGMVGEPEVYVAEAIKLVRPVIDRDLKGGFDASLEKTAAVGCLPNIDHPVLTTFKEFCKEAHALMVYTNSLHTLREGQAEVRA